MMRIWCAGLLLMLSPSVWAANLALIIGNSQYGNGIDSLVNPINDAQAVDAQLKRLGFQTTVVKNADKIQMLEAIDDFTQKINRGDTVLFFYAGHGASANGNNYLIPSKAAIPKSDHWMDEHFIDLDTKVASRLSQSPASYKLVVMDACRDNPIARTRSSGTRAFARTDQTQNSAGLSFLYSASKGQQAQDGRAGASPFTAAFVNRLKVPNLKWPELVDDVAQDVRQQTKNQQEVWQEGNTLARFVLNAQQVEATEPQVVAHDNPHTAEIAAWNNIKGSSRASDYQGFLRSYPSGLFAEAAQLKLNQLNTNILSKSDLEDCKNIIRKQYDEYVIRQKDSKYLTKYFVSVRGSKAQTEQIAAKLTDFLGAQISAGHDDNINSTFFSNYSGCIAHRSDILGTAEGAQCLASMLGDGFYVGSCASDGFPYNLRYASK